MKTRKMASNRGCCLLLCLILTLTCLAMAAGPSKAETDAFNFAQGLYVYRDFKSAAEEFRAFLKKYPASENAGNARHRLADSLFQLRDFKAAAEAYDKALAGDPAHADAGRSAYNLGRSRYRLQHYDEALEAFRMATAKGNAQIVEEASVGIGETLSRLERFQEAVANYRKFLADYPNSDHRGDVMYALGWTEAKLDNHEAAVEVLRTLLRDVPGFPESAKARLALSDSLAALDRHGEAGEVLAALDDNAAVKSDVLLRRAWSFFNSQRYADAARAFVEFAEAYPDHELTPSASFNAGVSFFKADNFKAAVEPLSRAVDAGNKIAQADLARYWLGLCHAELGQNDKAAEILSLLVSTPRQLTPEQHAGVIWALARVRKAQGDREAAVKLYEDYLEGTKGQPAAAEMTYALAVEKGAAGETAAAAALLAERLETIPPGELRDKALFAAAEFHYRLKQPEKALIYLEELADRPGQGDDPKIMYRHAWSLFDCGEYERAEALFGKLAGGTSEFAGEALFLRARTLDKLERRDEALKAYRTSLQGPLAGALREEAFYRLGLLLPEGERKANLHTYEKEFPAGRFLAQMRLKVAEDLFADDQFAEARGLYSKAGDSAAQESVKRAAAYGLAWTAMKQQRYDEARVLFARLREANPSDAIGTDATLQLAEIACGAEQYAAAIPLLEAILQDSLHAERATYLLAWSNRHLGNADRAGEMFRKVIDKWPQGQFAADAALRLAEILTAAGQPEKAAQLLRETSFETTPLREEALHARCDALAATNNWKQLMAAAKTLRDEFPDSKRRYLAAFYLGRANQALGITAKAEEYFRKTIEETDTVEAAKAQFNIGALRFAEEDYAAAARQFLRVDMIYDYPEIAAKALYHAADAFDRAGDAERAEMYRKRLKELYPASEWAKR